jgi:hypothetical protein
MDLKNYSIIRNGNITVSIPRYNITCDVVDSQNGKYIRSFNVTFPNVLNNLSEQQLDELFTSFIDMIIKKKIDEGVN